MIHVYIILLVLYFIDFAKYNKADGNIFWFYHKVYKYIEKYLKKKDILKICFAQILVYIHAGTT